MKKLTFILYCPHLIVPLQYQTPIPNEKRMGMGYKCLILNNKGVWRNI